MTQADSMTDETYDYECQMCGDRVRILDQPTHILARHQADELPVREPGRAVIIAAIHAYAEWLADHPEVPAPETVYGTAPIDPERLERFADANGFTHRAESVCARLTIVAYVAQGVHIEHAVVARPEPEAAAL